MWLSLCLVVVASGSVSVAEDALPWWMTATLYQVYPRSFKDSDGDGVGDLKGITQNAEYFKDIGVDAIWLSPIFKSPMHDHGYDISDFRDIAVTFGTLDDFRDLLAKFKYLGIKVLIDMVPNHSSDQHVWFNKSVNRIEPYTDYYVWSDGKFDNATQTRVPPDNWMSVFNIGSAWTWHDVRQQFYFHQFSIQQPDLNYWNPAVIKEFDEIMRFWMDMGVSGFRMDAVIHLIETNYTQDEPQLPGHTGIAWKDLNHTHTACQPESVDLLNHWDELVYNHSLRDGVQRALFMEAYASTECTFAFYGHGNTRFAMPFNFRLLKLGSMSVRAPDLYNIIDTYLSSLAPDEVPNWDVGNHDNMRTAERYGPEAVDAIGILQGVLPGVKVVYYGEEIGMRDAFIRWDQTVDPIAYNLGPDHYMEDTRDPVRTPMQWDDSSPSAGFSTNSTTWLPVNPNYWWLNVKAQKAAAESHLKVFQDVSRIRKDPVLQRGNVTFLVPNNDTFVIVRSYKGVSYTYIFNMGSNTIDYTTQNFFSVYNLDAHMSVEVASINCDVTKGTFLKKGAAVISLRPKAAVVLRSPPSSSNSNSAPRGLHVLPVVVSLPLLLPFITLTRTVIS